jgi:hypothetical protein
MKSLSTTINSPSCNEGIASILLGFDAKKTIPVTGGN